jgi:hypothetical protein
MEDYSELMLECNAVLKDIHKAALGRKFELARQLTESLNFLTQELSMKFGRLYINDKH